ncbi:MAG: T9SS type A sorting domain-containing protein [Bacteroidales bacterium]|nr:T9SS type A sorting domain-containing protein [Bacteroidales bacterium]
MNKNLLQKEKLSSRLAGYALTGGALLAVGSVASGQVNYSGIQNLPVTDPINPVELDLDGDLHADFAFGLALTSTYWNNYSSYNSAFIMASSGTYQNSWVGISMNIAIPEETIVFTSNYFTDNRVSYWNLGFAMVFSTSSYGTPAGSFAGQGDKILGVKFYIGSELHYGWIRINIPAEVNTITIIDWAYDETPGRGIKAGAMVESSDVTGPVVTMVPDVLPRTNIQTTTIAVSIDEKPHGILDISDFTAVNGILDGLIQTTDTSYDLTVTAEVHGNVQVSLNPGVLTDYLLNSNSGTTINWFYDNRPPVTTMNLAAGALNNLSSLSASLVFDEEVIGLAVSDFVLTNCIITSLTEDVANKEYTLELDLLAEGPASIVLPAASVVDYGNNPNLEATVSWEYDGTVPTHSFSRGFNYITAEETVLMTIDFSEEIQELVAEDLTIEGATIANITENTAGLSYDIQLTHITEGMITLQLDPGSVLDLAGNAATGGSTSWYYDITAPVLSIDIPVTRTNSDTAMTIQINADELVSGLTLDDIIVTNGTASNLVVVPVDKGMPSPESASYRVDITPIAEGEVSIEIPADAVYDNAGNTNSAASASYIYDLTGPTPSMTAGSSELSNNETGQLTITFDEPVTGLSADAFVITNGTAGSLTTLTEGTEYKLDVNVSDQGMVVVELPAGAVADEAGNLSVAAATVAWTYDGIAPTASLSSGLTEPTEELILTITIDFNEEVEGLALDDFNPTNGTVSNLVEVTAGLSYTLDITATAAGEVSVELAAGAVTDAAGNKNAAASVSYTYEPNVAVNMITDLQVKLYPNPASEALNVELDRAATLYITDVNGRIAMVKEEVLSERFDISTLPSGMYILSIETEAGIAVRKFVKE